MIIKSFVNFISAGKLFPKRELSKKMKSRNIDKIRIPKGTYGIEFHDMVFETLEDNASTAFSLTKPVFYYIGTKFYTKGEFKEYMKKTGYDKKFYPFQVENTKKSLKKMKKDEVILQCFDGYFRIIKQRDYCLLITDAGRKVRSYIDLPIDIHK